LCAEVDVLLTLEQYQQVVPETLASYLAYGTRIHFERITVPVSHICGLCETPTSLLKWDASNRSLDPLSVQVIFHASVLCILIAIVLGVCRLF
jgi:hypothetical protein